MTEGMELMSEAGRYMVRLDRDGAHFDPDVVCYRDTGGESGVLAWPHGRVALLWKRSEGFAGVDGWAVSLGDAVFDAAENGLIQTRPASEAPSYGQEGGECLRS